MSIVVFWLHEYIEDDTMLPYLAADPCFKKFKDIELSAALAFAEQQRKAGHSHVTISSELSNHVGKARDQHESVVAELRTAIQQAESAEAQTKTDVRCEGCGYMTHHREHMGCVRAAKQFTHPSPGVPDAAIDSAIYNQCPDFDDWHEGPSIDDIRAIVRAAIDAAQAQKGK